MTGHPKAPHARHRWHWLPAAVLGVAVLAAALSQAGQTVRWWGSIRLLLENDSTVREQRGEAPVNGSVRESELREVASAAFQSGWQPGEPVVFLDQGSGADTPLKLRYLLQKPAYFFCPSPMFAYSEGFPDHTRWALGRTKRGVEILSKNGAGTWCLAGSVGADWFLYQREGEAHSIPGQVQQNRWKAANVESAQDMRGAFPGLLQVLALFGFIALWGEGIRRATGAPHWHGAVSWSLGLAALVLVLTLWGMATNHAMSHPFLIPSLLALTVLTWLAARFRTPEKRPSSWTSSGISALQMTLAAAVLILPVFLVVSFSTSTELQGSAGLGMYGARAKLWWLAGSNPDGFRDIQGGYAHVYPDYPPGWSHLLHATSSIGDSWEERWVKLWPGLCALMMIVGMLSLLRAKGAWWFAALPLLALLTTRGGFQIQYMTYPDYALCLLAWAGLSLLLLPGAGVSGNKSRTAHTGLFLLSVCPLIKNEGGLYFLTGLSVFMIFDRKCGWKVKASACLWLPVAGMWLISNWFHGVKSQVFNWSLPLEQPASETMEKTRVIFRGAGEVFFAEGGNFIGAFWTLPVLLAVCLWKQGKVENRLDCAGTGRMALTCGLLGLGLSSVYIFSSVSLSQHMSALSRTGQPVAWLIWFAVLHALRSQQFSSASNLY